MKDRSYTIIILLSSNNKVIQQYFVDVFYNCGCCVKNYSRSIIIEDRRTANVIDFFSSVTTNKPRSIQTNGIKYQYLTVQIQEEEKN